MRSLATLSLTGTLALTLSTLPSAIDKAVDAVDAGAINVLQFTASGATFAVVQNFSPHDPWPRIEVKRYTAVIDYAQGAIQQDLAREMGVTMPRGGGVPFTGELHQIESSDAHSAWDVPVPPDPAAGSLP